MKLQNPVDLFSATPFGAKPVEGFSVAPKSDPNPSPPRFYRIGAWNTARKDIAKKLRVFFVPGTRRPGAQRPAHNAQHLAPSTQHPPGVPSAQRPASTP